MTIQNGSPLTDQIWPHYAKSRTPVWHGFEGKQKVAARLAIFSAHFTHIFTCSTLKKHVLVGHMIDTNYSIPFPGHVLLHR